MAEITINPDLYVYASTCNGCEFDYLDSGDMITLPPCHNDYGPCGGKWPIEIEMDTSTVSNMTVTGQGYSLDYIDYPIKDHFRFYVNFSFNTIGTYTGQLKIITDDEYYRDGFVINFTGEKY